MLGWLDVFDAGRAAECDWESEAETASSGSESSTSSSSTEDEQNNKEDSFRSIYPRQMYKQYLEVPPIYRVDAACERRPPKNPPVWDDFPLKLYNPGSPYNYEPKKSVYRAAPGGNLWVYNKKKRDTHIFRDPPYSVTVEEIRQMPNCDDESFYHHFDQDSYFELNVDHLEVPPIYRRDEAFEKPPPTKVPVWNDLPPMWNPLDPYNDFIIKGHPDIEALIEADRRRNDPMGIDVPVLKKNRKQLAEAERAQEKAALENIYRIQVEQELRRPQQLREAQEAAEKEAMEKDVMMKRFIRGDNKVADKLRKANVLRSAIDNVYLVKKIREQQQQKKDDKKRRRLEKKYGDRPPMNPVVKEKSRHSRNPMDPGRVCRNIAKSVAKLPKNLRAGASNVCERVNTGIETMHQKVKEKTEGVFGGDLMDYDKVLGQPKILYRTIEEIKKRDPREKEYLYADSNYCDKDLGRIDRIKKRFLNGEDPKLAKYTTHVLGGVVMSFLNDLSGKVIPEFARDGFLAAGRIQCLETREAKLIDLVAALPLRHQAVLGYLVQHLREVPFIPDIKVNLNVLALVFGPLVMGLKSPEERIWAKEAMLGILKLKLKYFGNVFHGME